MDFDIKILLRDSNKSYILDSSLLKITECIFITEMKYDDVLPFVVDLLEKINKTKTELYMKLSAEDAEYHMISLLVNNRVYVIDKYWNEDDQEFDFANSKFRRKAKIDSLTNSNVNLDPKHLWVHSWYNSLTGSIYTNLFS